MASSSPQQIDDDTLQYMHSTPIFNLDQQRRFEDLQLIGTEVKKIAAHFTSYTDLGQRMCGEFTAITDSLKGLRVLGSDAVLQPLLRLFSGIRDAFATHLKDVFQHIVTELNRFGRKELEELANLERDHQRQLKDLHAAEDEYITLKTQVAPVKKQRTEQALTQTHGCSTLAFFAFCQKMDGIELKLKSVLPRVFIAFIQSMRMPFKNCLKNIDDQIDFLNDAQSSLQEIDKQVLDFSQHSVQLKQRLSCQIPVFWNRLIEPFAKTANTSIQGYLWKKKTKSLGRNWQKRFFMVSNGILSWANSVSCVLRFRSEKTIQLVFCSIRPEPLLTRANCFSVSRPGAPPMILQALTSWDMEQWLAVMQNNVLMRLNAGTPGAQIAATTQHCDTFCADCGAPNSAWCSMNWGVTICEACAGEHRGLGAAVSKVRSLHLDRICAMQRALVEAVGAEKGNAVLELNLPAGRKIAPEATPEERVQFAAAKYRDLEFAEVPDDDLDIMEAIQDQDLMGVYCYIAGGRLRGLNGFTPLHAAACVGNPIIMHLLCLNTPRPDVLDEGGWSPLAYAVFHDQDDIVEVLLMHGADLQREGVNPYDIAKSKGREGLIGKLLALSATSAYEPGAVHVPPHSEVQPRTFDLASYVRDPAPYAPESSP
jgi:hypothetical protein